MGCWPVREHLPERGEASTASGATDTVGQIKAVVDKDNAKGGLGRAALARESGIGRQTLYTYPGRP
jgi:hypothetical protein